jgi:hypothetical protein
MKSPGRKSLGASPESLRTAYNASAVPADHGCGTFSAVSTTSGTSAGRAKREPVRRLRWDDPGLFLLVGFGRYFLTVIL